MFHDFRRKFHELSMKEIEIKLNEWRAVRINDGGEEGGLGCGEKKRGKAIRRINI